MENKNWNRKKQMREDREKEKQIRRKTSDLELMS